VFRVRTLNPEPAFWGMNPDPGFYDQIFRNCANEKKNEKKLYFHRAFKQHEIHRAYQKEHQALHNMKFLNFLHFFVGNFCFSGLTDPVESKQEELVK
jgi:hypothetical protein